MYALKITLSHATALPASDLNGASDPYVAFSVAGQSARSSCRAATLAPVWSPREHFDFKISDPEQQTVLVQVYDHDLISKDDLLGAVSIPLVAFIAKVTEDSDTISTPTDKTAVTVTSAAPRAFPLDVPASFHHKLTSELFLALRVVPLDATDHVLELWENECYVLGKGWSSGPGTLLHHRARWSSDDGRVSSDHFEQVAPKVAPGFLNPGWSFSVGKGDPDGWLYATTFAGPWYDTSNALAVVRRRKWVNPCRRMGSARSLRSLQF